MDALAWCRERLLNPGQPLAASLPFADPEQRDRILALRALISEIAGSGEQAGEGERLAATLAWWQSALVENNAHPAIQAARSSGVFDRLNASDFAPLMFAVARAAENPRFTRLSDLWAFCRELGGHAARLEWRLLEDSDAEAALELGAAAYLIRITRDLAIDARHNRWLVPLDLQADFQVSRQDALKSELSGGLSALILSLLSEAVARGQRAATSIQPDQARRHRHLLLQWALDQRLAAHIARRPARILKARITPSHPGNVWRAWRSARALR